MYALNRPARLTGRARVRLSRFLRRIVVEVEEEQDCIASLNQPPSGENVVKGYAWRRAGANDIIALGDRLKLDASAC